MVSVAWYGHACVSAAGSNGYTIVFDPHDGISIGLPRPVVYADLVLVTHDHFDHNAVHVVSKKDTRIIKELNGVSIIDDLEIEGILTYHDKFQGRRRGTNTVYIVKVDGYKIAHLGDIGHIPGEDVLRKLENTDLLIIPVGGTYTIEPFEAWDLVEQVKPKNVLPIHYWVEGLNLPLYPIDDFLVNVKKYRIQRLNTNRFDLEKYDKSIIIPKLVHK